MTFLELFRKLESQMGYHQLPLAAAPTTLKNLYECSPLHHDTMMRLAQAVYAANGCRLLTSPVERDATFDAVGPIRLELLRAKHTDIDLYHFIEDLCVALDNAFGAQPRQASAAATASQSATVIPMAPFRRRIKTSV